ncbi:MAG: Asp-tRNA(Asn)/Glu-tRNA(Gln) amidotransferase GatCAB subunit A, partial [Candidatus Nitrotoga sp.]|nr:Asp-tRNA(Asn)/Glu-tRNA(Gln) amidotransferase GatCAB subunit A [Candidatus Nitrotoga sp.]
MIKFSLLQLGDALRSKKISSVELTQLYLDRIAALNPELNAYITVNEEMTLAQARAADVQLKQGEGGALTGIPVAQKDIFCAAGW